MKQYFNSDKNISTLIVNQCKDDNPLLTFFIPTYKRADTLKDTLNSIQNNHLNISYQILIIDNSANFEKDNKVRELINQYPSLPIDYYINKENLGMEGNWNQGLLLSKSEYVSFVHDDDLISSDYERFISQIIAILKKNKRCAFFKARYDYFSKIDDVEQLEKNDGPKKYFYKCTKTSALVNGDNQTYTPSCGMIFKRSVFLEIGGFNPSFHPSSDNEIGTRLWQNKCYGIASSWVCGHYRLGLNESMETKTIQEFVEKNYVIRHNNYQLDFFAKLFSHLFEKYLYSSDIDFWIKYAKEKFDKTILVKELDFKKQYKQYKRRPFFLKVIGKLDAWLCKKYKVI